MSTIVKTAGKQFRLYSEDGENLGTFTKLREAKKRQLERETWKKMQPKKKNGNKTISK